MFNFKEMIEKQGAKMTIAGFNFDTPNMDMLVVTEDTFEEHLAKQPAALAYYGVLYKDTKRAYEDLERKNNIRRSEMYGVCSSTLNKTAAKSTVKDIDALIQSKYTAELEKMAQELSELKAAVDCLEVYYASWQQKSYTLTSYSTLVASGVIVPKSSVGEEDYEKANARRSALEHFKNAGR
jgi:hypothetical protein